MTKLTIERKRWLRKTRAIVKSDEDYDAVLYDSKTRKMCCLGFACRQLGGAKIEEIKDFTTPDRAGFSAKIIIDSNTQNKLMDINDRSYLVVRYSKISDAEQERLVKKEFAKFGVRVKFV